MSDQRYHLAQINVGRLLAPIDDARIAGFVNGLEPINRLAEASPGFVWRLQSEIGNATDIHLTEDELFIINLSVWESMEALRDIAYATAHVEVLRRRREWFERHAEAHFALWWIEAGTLPSPADALERVARLAASARQRRRSRSASRSARRVRPRRCRRRSTPSSAGRQPSPPDPPPGSAVDCRTQTDTGVIQPVHRFRMSERRQIARERESVVWAN